MGIYNVAAPKAISEEIIKNDTQSIFYHESVVPVFENDGEYVVEEENIVKMMESYACIGEGMTEEEALIKICEANKIETITLLKEMNTLYGEANDIALENAINSIEESYQEFINEADSKSILDRIKKFFDKILENIEKFVKNIRAMLKKKEKESVDPKDFEKEAKEKETEVPKYIDAKLITDKTIFEPIYVYDLPFPDARFVLRYDSTEEIVEFYSSLYDNIIRDYKLDRNDMVNSLDIDNFTEDTKLKMEISLYKRINKLNYQVITVILGINKKVPDLIKKRHDRTMKFASALISKGEMTPRIDEAIQLYIATINQAMALYRKQIAELTKYSNRLAALEDSIHNYYK